MANIVVVEATSIDKELFRATRLKLAIWATILVISSISEIGKMFFNSSAKHCWILCSSLSKGKSHIESTF